MKKIVLNFLTFIVMIVPAFAQENSIWLRGKVLDSKKNGLEYCTVSLLDAKDSSLVSGTITKTDGQFMLPKIRKGVYILRASFIGYETFFQNISLLDNSSRDILMKESANNIKEVQVIANRIDYKFNKYIINMVNNPIAKGKNIMQTLGFMPGVMNIEGKLSVNGIEVSKIYINGREVRDMSELQGLQATNVNKVVIIPLSGKNLRADETGSIIKITLNKITSGYYGNINTTFAYGKKLDKENVNVPFNYCIGKLSLYNYFSLLHMNDHYLRDITTNYYTVNKDIDTHSDDVLKKCPLNELFSLVYAFNSKHDIGFTFNTLQEPRTENVFSYSNIKGDTPYSSTYLQSGKRHTHQYQGTLNYNWQLDKQGSTFAFVADYLNNNNQYKDLRYDDYSAVLTNDTLKNRTYTASNQWKITADWTIGRWKNTELSFGGDYYSNKNKHDITYEEKKLSEWEADNNLSDQFRYIGSGSGVYSDYTRSIGNFTLNAALRAQNDRIQIHSKDDIKYTRNYLNFFPGMSLSYLINKKNNMSINGGITRGMSSIRYSDMNPVRIYISDNYYQRGNPDLRPVTWYRSNLNFRLNNHLDFSYLFTKTSNRIFSMTYKDETDPGVTYWMPVNTGHSFEHELTVNYNADIFKWWTTNTVLSTSITKQSYEEFNKPSKRLLLYSDSYFQFSPRNGLMLDFMWEKRYKVLELSFHNVYNLYLQYYQYLLKNKVLFTLSTNYFLHKSRVFTIDNDIYYRQESNKSNRYYISMGIAYTFKNGAKVKAKKAKSILNMQQTTIGAK